METPPFHTGLGRRPRLADELARLDAPGLGAGRVLAVYSEQWLVAPGDPHGSPVAGGVPATAEPRLVRARKRIRDEGGSIVTGDWVALDPDGAIAAVLERERSLVRRAAGAATAAQVLAANVDLVLVAEALPDPGVRRAERFATLARAAGIPVVLVATKADLDDDAHEVAARAAREAGITVAHAVSTKEPDGLAALGPLLEPGSTIAVVGRSGAGKSSLVNALAGADVMATGAVRAYDGRGRHTTVTRELVPIPGGAFLLDTPGLREVATWDGHGDVFDDIDELALSCRFPDCAHDSEPGCAVRGVIAPERLEAWRVLGREQARLDDRRAAARDREERGKKHVRLQREARRRKGREDD